MDLSPGFVIIKEQALPAHTPVICGAARAHFWDQQHSTGETASGWQQTLFSTPIAINANITYVVSLFSPSGDYAANAPYFTQAVVNGPLRALANGEDGPMACTGILQHRFFRIVVLVQVIIG